MQGQILLPPPEKVRDKVPESDLHAAHTPDLLDRFYSEIDSKVQKGDLVLVAGGFIGKLLIARAQAKGAIALDIGAAVDYWLGFKTRNVTDFI